MTRLGQKKHLKRLPAPSHWPIRRKNYKFTSRVRPGPHRKEDAITLSVLVTDILGYAQTMNELKRVLFTGQVLVDGRTRKQPGFPVGLMDVVQIKNSGERFRVLPKIGGGLRLVAIDEKEMGVKLCRIEKKKVVAGGRIQLTFHDGRNMLLPEDKKASDFNPLDTVKISIPEQTIVSRFSLDKGAYAIVTAGNNVGIEGRVLDIQKRYGTHASTVTIEGVQGTKFQTAIEYVFVVGKQSPEVSLGSKGGASA
jgi:small subunit ribosomal protein S4e